MGVCGINVRLFCLRLFFTPSRLTFFLLIVTFRVVVFRPFVSEVVLAKVKSSDEDGIRRMLVSFLAMLYLPKLIFVFHSFG